MLGFGPYLPSGPGRTKVSLSIQEGMTGRRGHLWSLERRFWA
jgi:hypothetical protein